MKNNKLFFLFTLLVLNPLYAFALSESRFYTETINNGITRNLVNDYGANGSDTLDDSQTLQIAIDDVAGQRNGGKIIIPSGVYYLGDIQMRSKVHLVIDSNATIIPELPRRASSIFVFGKELGLVENTSIRGSGGKFTVDFRSVQRNAPVMFALLANVRNFLIANYHLLDNFTTHSSLNFNQGGGSFAMNGVVKDLSDNNAKHGYGLVQVRAARNVLFKRLKGIGGVTLRLESGFEGPGAQNGTIDQIFGRNITTRDGNAALMLSPHSVNNGKVDIRNITSYGSASAVRMERGDFKNGNFRGSFAAGSVVRRVHAIFGARSATLKRPRWAFLPCEVRHLIDPEPIFPGVKPHLGPSITAVMFTARGDGDGYYGDNIWLSRVTQEGFEFTDEIRTHEDQLRNCP